MTQTKHTHAMSGERFSFFQLFDDKSFRLEIPIIQRDYAQGRPSEQNVRQSFLQALYDYLDAGYPFRDLDFVYGTQTSLDNNTVHFIPLDGQQRLTTLFLLHWYLAQIANKSDVFALRLSSSGRSHFTYETRPSSREFCDELISAQLDFNALLMLGNGKESLSATIQDQAWFYLSWKNDPTIVAMLNMLDAIHHKFKGCTTFFDRLTHPSEPVITFRFLNLDQFNLTDDLYIKMNARGKPLTHFENFKAQLEKQIQSYQGEWPVYQFNFSSDPVTGYEYFIHKIDTDWTEIFWAYRNKISNTYDDELMNFIAIVIANFKLLKMKSIDENLIKFLFGNNSELNKIEFSDYLRNDCFSQDLIATLIKNLDLIFNDGLHQNALTTHLSENPYYQEELIFKKTISNTTSYTEKLRFHAFYAGLAKGKSGEELSAWMRVIYNLTENTIYNTADEYHRSLHAIQDLLKEDGSILEILSQEKIVIESFSKAQIYEEKIKAHLIKNSTSWKNTIIEFEDHPFFRGQIGFALRFSGIVKYYASNKNTNWPDTENVFFEKFIHYKKSAVAVFSSIRSDSSNINFSWERAVLSKGFYLTKTSADRYNLLNTRVVKNNIERDHSWRRLLRLSFDNIWIEKQSYVQQVFDDSKFDASNLQNSLEAICRDGLNILLDDDWRRLFILNPDLFKICNQGFIVINNDEIVLLHESQRNHYQSELYSKYLELELLSDRVDYSPFQKILYQSVRSEQERAYVYFDELGYNDSQYILQIWYERDHYRLFFYINDKQKRISDDLLKIAKELGFLELDEWKAEAQDPEDHWENCVEDSMVLGCKNPEEAINKIESFCLALMGTVDD